MLGKDRSDISGVVCEEVADVLVFGDAPAGQRRLDVIDASASVGVDQPANERECRMLPATTAIGAAWIPENRGPWL
jgi:hypothetical protein